MLLGLLYPSGGRISVFGHSPRHVQTKSRIGYLPEESYLYRYLNSEETVDFFGSLFHIDSKERRVRAEQLIEMVGLENARRRHVGEFSKGMQRRIGLAQALINDPDLIVLDEPTSGLDPIGCREIKDLILTLAERGKTVILSSHRGGCLRPSNDTLWRPSPGYRHNEGAAFRPERHPHHIPRPLSRDDGPCFKTNP